MCSHWILRPSAALIAVFVVVASGFPSRAGIITPANPASFLITETIVQGATGNGSFEGGITTNWYNSSAEGLAAGNANPPGATDGSYYLRIYDGISAANSRVDLRRRSLSYENGLTDGAIFKVTLDYYVPATAGYTTLVLQPLTMSGTTSIESLGSDVITPMSATGVWLSRTVWFEATLDGFNGLDFRVEYRRSSPVAGTTYEGFIDNVVIQQGYLVPEPATLALLALGLTAIVRRRRRGARPATGLIQQA